MNRHEPRRIRRNLMLHGAVGLVALGAMALAAPACLDRPVAPQQPTTSKLSTKLYKNTKVDKIDLLFMIDNSASMADKQLILAEVVPDLVDRLTNPVCVDRTTRQFVANPPPGAGCPDPNTQEREFEPVKDIHIGLITSSIGGHGADSCSPTGVGTFNPRQADMSHLITRTKAGGNVATWANKGFLNWDQRSSNDPQKPSPPGESNVETLRQNFTEMVKGAGEDGCGFEASLEAWYRFLVDPAPYQAMVPCPCYDGDTANQCRCPDGLDTVVLQQRADMIRQDSLLAVIMLSDENDCSVMDGGQNFLALQAYDGSNPFHLARGTDACLSDPWSAACKSCWAFDAASAPPECVAGWANADKDDPLNLRCFNQKKRFGINFLQPIKRYVDGLTQQRFPNGTPDPADDPLNPVFCSKYKTNQDGTPNVTECDGEKPLRDPSLVFLAGIVGVPWQDIARDPNNLASGYRTAEELSKRIKDLDNPPATTADPSVQDKTLWDVILGQTHADGEVDQDPLDPLMIESVDPRTGTNPITGAALVPPSSANPLGNPINGSEWDIVSRADLQYACIFQLPTPVNCANATCDCSSSQQNPLCYDGSGFGTTQYRAKAYPGRRQLAVLKGVGGQGIVASICPAKVDPNQKSAPDWGYRPAIAAIVDRLKGALTGTCWDVPLPVDEAGQVPCIVLEATKSTDVDAQGNVICPPCDDGTGVRQEATDAAKAALAKDSTFVNNQLNCVCEIKQIADPGQLQACIHDDAAAAAGWCYLDGKDPNANQNLLASCPSDQKRLIRFVGNEIPKTGSLTFLQCKGASLGTD